MNITSTLRSGLGAITHFLNQPNVKESVKKIAGVATFIFGLIELYDIYQILRGKEISTEIDKNAPQWQQTATKITMVFAKISLILSAATSRPGVFVISNLAGQVLTQTQLERLFGPNTIFAINPWHPRHVASIAATILTIPAVAQMIYLGSCWTYRKVCQLRQDAPLVNDNQGWLTDAKVRMMTLFNTLTSRPVLHLGNQLMRRVV
jgi:hypothetical protein